MVISVISRDFDNIKVVAVSKKLIVDLDITVVLLLRENVRPLANKHSELYRTFCK